MIRSRGRATALAVVAAIVVVAVAFTGALSPDRKSRAHRSASAGPAHVRLAGKPARADAGASREHQATATVQAVRSVPSPGSLPQTNAFPSAGSPRFKSLMDSLWAGVVQDSASKALPAFFPEGAYVQLKAIAGAGADWKDRLVYDYSLDIAAAHALLGSDPTHARLVRVAADQGYGHWVEPGACYNSIGYWELPNARVVYSEGGELHSFGIASMISWRGVWYVVHLGAVLRSSDTGIVDEPASGHGVSEYSGTC